MNNIVGTNKLVSNVWNLSRKMINWNFGLYFQWNSTEGFEMFFICRLLSVHFLSLPLSLVTYSSTLLSWFSGDEYKFSYGENTFHREWFIFGYLKLDLQLYLSRCLMIYSREIHKCYFPSSFALLSWFSTTLRINNQQILNMDFQINY